MESKGLFGIAQRLATSRFGIVSIVCGAVYTGYANADVLRRVEHGVLYKTMPVAQGFFKDPAGLRIETSINSQGAVEVYLVHESGSRQAVLYDLLPDTKTVFLALSKRINQELPEQHELSMPLRSSLEPSESRR